VGVASTSKHKSIRIWNNHERYDEWEFLGIGTTPEGAAGAQPGTPATGAQPGSQGLGTGTAPLTSPIPSSPQNP